jgi:hypothetical protein
MLSAASVLLAITIAFVVGIIFRLAAKSRRGCPRCGTMMPGVRRPVSVQQALWGGWTCQSCGCEMDRQGREISAPATPPQ